jgi:murein DD-endopeptidase MepM/ murein hydrolase activator NlpD
VHQKKRKTKYYTFLLIPDNERTTHTLRFSIMKIRLFIALSLVLLVSVVFGLVTYWPLATMYTDYVDLQKDNESLRKSLGQVKEIQSDLEYVKKSNQKLRASLSGYVKIVENNDADPASEMDLFEQTAQERAMYNSLPSIFPVEGFYTITRGFEIGSFLKEPHMAIDIAGKSGLPVKATADGIVVFSGWTHQEGNVIILQHKYGYMSFYKHNMKNIVQNLQQVKKGQVIALLGGSGQITSGVHLHFEVWKDSKPIDPIRLIKNEK